MIFRNRLGSDIRSSASCSEIEGNAKRARVRPSTVQHHAQRGHVVASRSVTWPRARTGKHDIYLLFGNTWMHILHSTMPPFGGFSSCTYMHIQFIPYSIWAFSWVLFECIWKFLYTQNFGKGVDRSHTSSNLVLFDALNWFGIGYLCIAVLHRK